MNKGKKEERAVLRAEIEKLLRDASYEKLICIYTMLLKLNI